jgi:tetratricopeptide (TPR) repeat protein
MRIVALAAVVLLTACAYPSTPVRSPTPADIPSLEAAVARDPGDVTSLVALGAAYRTAGRREEAAARLEQALVLRPDDPAATVFLGLTYEESGDPARARDLYQRYLEVGGSETVKGQLRQRVALLTRAALVARAQQMARDEEAGITAPAAPRTVAVFPFVYIGTDPQYRPLERAMAELLVTDLAQTSRLTVLERLQVQALVDELQFSSTVLVDPATAARSGRLLRAERVVQGSIAIDPGTLALNAAVVGATGEAARTAPVNAESLERLFDAEKQLAFALYESLGIELTIAERQRVEQRPTTNIQALLAFGEGLEAEDRGDYQAAAAHYARAASMDPDFTVAAERGAQTVGIVEAQTAGVTSVADQVATELEVAGGTTPDLAPLAPPSLDALSDLTGDPMRRDAVAEAFGVEGVAIQTILRIVFRRP